MQIIKIISKSVCWRRQRRALMKSKKKKMDASVSRRLRRDLARIDVRDFDLRSGKCFVSRLHVRKRDCRLRSVNVTVRRPARSVFICFDQSRTRHRCAHAAATVSRVIFPWGKGRERREAAEGLSLSRGQGWPVECWFAVSRMTHARDTVSHRA